MSFILSLEANVFCIIILLILALNTSVFQNNSHHRKSFCCTALWLSIVTAVFDLIWKANMTGSLMAPVGFLMFVNVMYFSSFAISIYFLFLYFEVVARRTAVLKPAGLILATLPLLAQLMLIVLSLYNGAVFYYDAALRYQRGPWFYVQQLLLYTYVIYLFGVNLYVAIYRRHYIRRKQLLRLAMFTVPILLCGLIEILFPHIPTSPMGLVITFLLVYVEALQNRIFHDEMTGISNREGLLRKLENTISSMQKGETLYFMFIDIDSFKQINDTYGHAEGDRTLKMVSTVLSKICKATNGSCARYGGDEFAVVQVLRRGEDITDLRRRIVSEVEQTSAAQGLAYSVSISVGCSVYQEGTSDLQSLLLEADTDMYAQKAGKQLGGQPIFKA